MAAAAFAAGCGGFRGARSSGVPATPPATAAWPDLRIDTSLMVPAGRHSRWRMKPMRPRYVTVHSTANTSRGAGARQHAAVLRGGGMRARHNALGYLVWHFTIDDRSIYQSLPCNETGEHADYDGPGNQSSIGIEICENRDADLRRTLDRASRFVAVLMETYDIPLRHVVPHYHWRQTRHSDRRDLGHKPCPRILMDGGRPGPRWAEFVGTIDGHRGRLG